MRLIVKAFFSGVSAGRPASRPGRMSHVVRRFNTMALDADAEPLTRDDIDGIIARGDPVERMFLLRRHDLTARQWLRLLSDGNILVRDDARDTLRDRAASRLLVLVGLYARPRMPFIDRHDLAGRIWSKWKFALAAALTCSPSSWPSLLPVNPGQDLVASTPFLQSTPLLGAVPLT